MLFGGVDNIQNIVGKFTNTFKFVGTTEQKLIIVIMVILYLRIIDRFRVSNNFFIINFISGNGNFFYQFTSWFVCIRKRLSLFFSQKGLFLADSPMSSQHI